MLSKLVDSPEERLLLGQTLRYRQRFGCKYIFSLAIAIVAIPSSAMADTSTGNINVSLQVVAKCSTPVTSSRQLSDRENIAHHSVMKCSRGSKPAVVRVVPLPVNTANPAQGKNKTINILVGY